MACCNQKRSRIYCFGEFGYKMSVNNVCRLCLSKENLVWVFDSRFVSASYMKDVIFITTGVEIHEKDVISQKICQRCCNLSVMMFKFRDTSQKHDRFLKAQYKKRLKTSFVEYEIPNTGVTIETKNEVEPKTETKKLNEPNNKIHRSIRDLFTMYPRLKLPSTCLTYNIEPHIMIERGTIDDFLKKRTKNEQKYGRLSENQVRIVEKATSLASIGSSFSVINAEQNEEYDFLKKGVIPKESAFAIVSDLEIVDESDNKKYDFLKNEDILTESSSTIISDLEIADENSNEGHNISNDESDHKDYDFLMKGVIPTEAASTIFGDLEIVNENSNEGDNFSDGQSDNIEEIAIKLNKRRFTDNDPSEPLVKMFICSICNSVHDNVKESKRHHSKHLRCQFCRSKFRTIDSKETHMRSMCSIKNTMKHSPSVQLERIELDLLIRMKYPEAFVGHLLTPGLQPSASSTDAQSDYVEPEDGTSGVEISGNKTPEKDINAVVSNSGCDDENDDIIEILSDDDTTLPHRNVILNPTLMHEKEITVMQSRGISAFIPTKSMVTEQVPSVTAPSPIFTTTPVVPEIYPVISTAPSVISAVSTTPLIFSTMPSVSSTTSPVISPNFAIIPSIPSVVSSAGPSTISSVVSTNPPVNSFTVPDISVASPVISTSLSAISITPPVISTTPPMISTTSPVITTTFPVISTTPPVISTTPPAISTTPPVTSTTPPAISTTTPVISKIPSEAPKYRMGSVSKLKHDIKIRNYTILDKLDIKLSDIEIIKEVLSRYMASKFEITESSLAQLPCNSSITKFKNLRNLLLEYRIPVIIKKGHYKVDYDYNSSNSISQQSKEPCLWNDLTPIDVEIVKRFSFNGNSAQNGAPVITCGVATSNLATSGTMSACTKTTSYAFNPSFTAVPNQLVYSTNNSFLTPVNSFNGLPNIQVYPQVVTSNFGIVNEAPGLEDLTYVVARTDTAQQPSNINTVNSLSASSLNIIAGNENTTSLPSNCGVANNISAATYPKSAPTVLARTKTTRQTSQTNKVTSHGVSSVNILPKCANMNSSLTNYGVVDKVLVDKDSKSVRSVNKRTKAAQHKSSISKVKSHVKILPKIANVTSTPLNRGVTKTVSVAKDPPSLCAGANIAGLQNTPISYVNDISPPNNLFGIPNVAVLETNPMVCQNTMDNALNVNNTHFLTYGLQNSFIVQNKLPDLVSNVVPLTTTTGCNVAGPVFSNIRVKSVWELT